MSRSRFHVGVVVGLVVLVGFAVALAPAEPASGGATSVTEQQAGDGGPGSGGGVGFVQSGAEATGQESSQQVVDRIEVVGVTGTELHDGEVGAVRVTVRQPPGAPDADLADATVRLNGPDGEVVLTHDGVPDSSFGVEHVQDDDDSLPVLNDAGDRATLVVDLGEDDVDADGPGAVPWTLSAGESAELTVTTESGGTTVVPIGVPEGAGDGPVALS